MNDLPPGLSFWICTIVCTTSLLKQLGARPTAWDLDGSSPSHLSSCNTWKSPSIYLEMRQQNYRKLTNTESNTHMMHKLMRICLHLPTCSNINKFLHAASKCRCLYTRIPYCVSFFILACQNFAASISHIWQNGKLQTCRIATKSPRLKYQAGGASECQEGWCCHTQWVHLRPIDFIAY